MRITQEVKLKIVKVLNKEYKLEVAMDMVKHRFGKKTVLRSSSEEEHLTVKVQKYVNRQSSYIKAGVLLNERQWMH